MASTRKSPRIEKFKVTTKGPLDDLSLAGAEITEDQLELLLAVPPGVIYAYNQDGVLIEVMFDMDAESVIAMPVVMFCGNAIDHPALAKSA